MKARHYHPQHPIWYDHHQINNALLRPEYRAWLLDQGSLTARLVHASNGNFRVKVLSQGWQRPSVEEARYLGIPLRQVALIRETALLCFDQPWVYARSIMPIRTLHSRLRHLAKLKDRPLGAILFNDPHLRRGSFEIAQIDARTLPALFAPMLREADQPWLWARRSNFYLKDRPIVVSEIFLPTFRP